jgi:hypothetical protein
MRKPHRVVKAELMAADAYQVISSMLLKLPRTYTFFGLAMDLLA